MLCLLGHLSFENCFEIRDSDFEINWQQSQVCSGLSVRLPQENELARLTAREASVDIS